ncbi:MAG: putative lipid II flippase FtsW [Candidatus Omnitrophica bacterium]|nr:putative lipid II flippase FtsW [Candidatus Omnitrophota bacterium]
MRKTRQKILLAAVILVALGAVMVYSASAIYAQERYNNDIYFLKRHICYVAIGIFLSMIIMSIDYHLLQRYTKIILAVSLALLALVLLPGIGMEINGARRWFRFGPFSFQPAELAKFAVILYLADFLSRKQTKIKSFFYGFLPPLMILGVTVGFVLLQPDMGTAVALVLVAFILFFVSGISWAHLIPTLISSVPVVIALVILEPYRLERILVFLNPWHDPRGSGYQIIQSFIALGSGGWRGIGLGHSSQKLFYLPESHTDFIFSILGEELGLLGAMGVVFLFVMLVWHGTRISARSQDMFGQLLALGMVSLIATQALINIGVVTGSLPTKGLPLPLVSYGGSALIFNMIEVGLLLNVSRYRNPDLYLEIKNRQVITI